MAVWIDATTTHTSVVVPSLNWTVSTENYLVYFWSIPPVYHNGSLFPLCTPTLLADDLVTYRTMQIEALETEYFPNIFVLIPRTAWKT